MRLKPCAEPVTMRMPKVDGLDLELLRAAALCFLFQKRKALEKAGNRPRTIQSRLLKLKKLGFLDSDWLPTEKGKMFIGGVESRRLEEASVVESHAFWFKCSVIRCPPEEQRRLAGWTVKKFTWWLPQEVRRDAEVRFKLTGSTLEIHVPGVVGPSPQRNACEAAKHAFAVVGLLTQEGWCLGDLVQDDDSHHVFRFLKPIAEAVYRGRGRMVVSGVIVDNSKKDGGEFEVEGEAKAEALLNAVATLPECLRDLSERVKALENEKKLKLNIESS